MRTYKKAGLSLSVNAIVVLVLAITMLGLGIAFTRNMFTSLEGQLLRNIDYENIPNPTSQNPISFESNRIYINANSMTGVGLKVYNPLTEVADFNIKNESCDIGDNTGGFQIDPGNIIDYAFVLQGSSTPGSISTCNLIFEFNTSVSGVNNRTVRTTLQIYTE